VWRKRTQRLDSAPMRLLVVELHHLGDAVLSLPFIRAAQTAGHEVHALCRPPSGAIFGMRLGSENIRTWIPRWERGIGTRPDAQPDLAGFDAAVCAWPDLRVHLLLARARIPRRIGFRVSQNNFYAPLPRWRQRRLRLGRLAQAVRGWMPGRPPLTEPLDRDLAAKPAQLGKWRTLARHLDLPWSETTPWFEGGAPPQPFADFLAQAHRNGRSLLLVHPGGRLPTKRWPAGRFHDLLTGPLAGRTDLAIVVIDPPDSPPLDPLPPDILRLATADIAELAAVTSAADVVLCNDSLVSHLAAAAGTRVIALFGSGDPDWFAPVGKANRIIATDRCPHRPCVDRCVMPSLVCLDSIRVESVTEQIRLALDSIRPGR